MRWIGYRNAFQKGDFNAIVTPTVLRRVSTNEPVTDRRVEHGAEKLQKYGVILPLLWYKKWRMAYCVIAAQIHRKPWGTLQLGF
jgi:hypothetical protein